MEVRAGRMISLEVGVADQASGKEIASLMMGEPSPDPGSERPITDGAVLKYLRAFDVSETAGAMEPSVWVDFAIRYDDNAAADPIAEWLMKTLKERGARLTLRLDTTEVPLEEGPITEMVRDKVKQSL